MTKNKCTRCNCELKYHGSTGCVRCTVNCTKFVLYYCSKCGRYYNEDDPKPHKCEFGSVIDLSKAQEVLCTGCGHRLEICACHVQGEYKSGAKSSEKALPYHAIDEVLLRRLALRLQKGIENYGEGNWQKGVNDKEYQKERYNHAMQHMINFNKDGNTKDDNLGAIACWVMFAMWWEENAEKT